MTEFGKSHIFFLFIKPLKPKSWDTKQNSYTKAPTYKFVKVKKKANP